MSEVDMGVEQPELPANDASAETESSTVAVDADTETSAETEQDSPKRTPWFQKRIDEVTAEKWELKRERDQLRDMLLQQQQRQQSEAKAPTEQPAGKPALENFASYEEFTEALTDWKFEQRMADRDRQQRAEAEAREAAQLRMTWAEKVEQVASAHEDFEQVAGIVPIAPGSQLERLILKAPNGAEVLYNAGRALMNDPQAHARIRALPDIEAAFELGRLAASATAPAQPRRINQPPPPINTPLAGGTAVTTDPARMTDAQFAAWRKAQIAQRR